MFHSQKVLLISLVVVCFFACHTTAQADPIIFTDQHNLATAALGVEIHVATCARGNLENASLGLFEEPLAPPLDPE